MSETVNMKDFEREQKKREFKAKLDNVIQSAQDKAKAAYEYAKENPQIVIGGLAALGGVTKLAKKGMDIHEEHILKDRKVYDMSGKHYWETKRKVTTDEWLEIEYRRRKGEGLGEILNSMGLLKR